MSVIPITPHGRLPENITYFCKALRRAGVPVGTAQVIDAIRAVETVGFTNRRDFFITLRASLITRPEHLQVFEQVFRMFWRDPEFLEKMITNLLPVINAPPVEKKPKPAENRAADAMADGATRDAPEQVRDELELDAQLSVSQNELLKNMDFEAMSNAEMRDAERAIAKMELPVLKTPSRRYQTASHGHMIDARAAFRAARRLGGEVLSLPRKRAVKQPPNLVVLCDISGSMSAYSRMMMHFIHSVSLKRGAGWARVHAFTFGTRLTNITRMLNEKEPDAALKLIGNRVNDWDGGTLIGTSLERFNKDWSRRVLGSNAMVLLITDGLERENVENLSQQMQRLSLSAKHILWLNPLLRWDGFEPQAMGIRAILPHVDSFSACHNLASLQELAELLSNAHNTGEKNRMKAML
ncbi:VWA domain-containing protein [Amylibacter ulvae]|uniref:VWA domain-containing protein n=1 Tax=Paramylibacter ulvae TaxID=1651968 RepID=A0ABQ3CSX7_9RHOB|nr:VWA domain-containing protein [Amylibacter ulvae]GHA42588.1 VWA domain-containing protein [Amylibacter ulvae]